MDDMRDRAVRDRLDAALLAWFHRRASSQPVMFTPAACWVTHSWLDVWPDLTVAQVGASLRRLRARGLVQHHRYSVEDQGWKLTRAERNRLIATREAAERREVSDG